MIPTKYLKFSELSKFCKLIHSSIPRIQFQQKSGKAFPRSKPAFSAIRPFHFRQLYFILEGLFRNSPSTILGQKKGQSSKVFFKLFPKSHHFPIFIFRIFPYFSWLYPFLTQYILSAKASIQILNVFWTFKNLQINTFIHPEYTFWQKISYPHRFG